MLAPPPLSRAAGGRACCSSGLAREGGSGVLRAGTVWAGAGGRMEQVENWATGQQWDRLSLEMGLELAVITTFYMLDIMCSKLLIFFVACYIFQVTNCLLIYLTLKASWNDMLNIIFI